jgi:hypothetical protein
VFQAWCKLGRAWPRKRVRRKSRPPPVPRGARCPRRLHHAPRDRSSARKSRSPRRRQSPWLPPPSRGAACLLLHRFVRSRCRCRPLPSAAGRCLRARRRSRPGRPPLRSRHRSRRSLGRPRRSDSVRARPRSGPSHRARPRASRCLPRLPRPHHRPPRRSRWCPWSLSPWRRLHPVPHRSSIGRPPRSYRVPRPPRRPWGSACPADRPQRRARPRRSRPLTRASLRGTSSTLTRRRTRRSRAT